MQYGLTFLLTATEAYKTESDSVSGFLTPTVYRSSSTVKQVTDPYPIYPNTQVQITETREIEVSKL